MSRSRDAAETSAPGSIESDALHTLLEVQARRMSWNISFEEAPCSPKPSPRSPSTTLCPASCSSPSTPSSWSSPSSSICKPSPVSGVGCPANMSSLPKKLSPKSTHHFRWNPRCKSRTSKQAFDEVTAKPLLSKFRHRPSRRCAPCLSVRSLMRNRSHTSLWCPSDPLLGSSAQSSSAATSS